MYGIRQCNRIFLSGEIGAFFTEIFFQISVVILNSNLHYHIFKFVIDNSDITSLNCLQHIQKRRNFDAKLSQKKAKSDMSPANLFTVTCHTKLTKTKWSRTRSVRERWTLDAGQLIPSCHLKFQFNFTWRTHAHTAHEVYPNYKSRPNVNWSTSHSLDLFVLFLF